MKISIIIPNRKGEKNETLSSLKKQTFKDFEIIEVIDKDGKGASWTRNQGLKKAKGRYIFFCDNDLTLEPDCLENLYNALQDNPQADWAFGKFRIDGIEFNNKKGVVPQNKYNKEFIDFFHGVSTMSLIRAKCKPKFDVNLKRFNDWDLWIRLTREGHKPIFLDKVLFSTVNKKGGISTGDSREANKQKLYDKHLKKIADIIIPHHSQHDMLANVLKRLDNKIFNIIIVSGGTFGENCNKGARLAETNNIIFLNDDTEPINDILVRMVEDKNDITGVAQYIQNALNKTKYGIGFNHKTFERFFANTPEEVDIPSGFCFKIKKNTWKKLGGFDERFRNGAEDIDLFFRATKMGLKIGYLEDSIQHYLSQSEGRFRFSEANEKLLEKKWKNWIFHHYKIFFKKKKNFKKNFKKKKNSAYIAKNDFYYRDKLYTKNSAVELEFQFLELLKEKGCI